MSTGDGGGGRGEDRGVVSRASSEGKLRGERCKGRDKAGVREVGEGAPQPTLGWRWALWLCQAHGGISDNPAESPLPIFGVPLHMHALPSCTPRM